MVNKKGAEKYYIIISLILGLMILTISLYWIFNEYFTEDDIGWEVCRQSILLRDSLPEKKIGPLSVASIKDKFPLKCKTQVVEIDRSDIENGRAGGIMGDTLVQCWSMFGGGDLNIFPFKFYGKTTSCVACARIHLTEDAENYLEEKNKKIDIEYSLNNLKIEGVSYLTYLNKVGENIGPFGNEITKPFNLGGSKFEVMRKFFLFPYLETSWGSFAGVNLPKFFEPGFGDLIISYGEVTTSENFEESHIPYLFYYQSGQEGISSEMDKTFFQWGITGVDPSASEKVCNNWEGIPA